MQIMSLYHNSSPTPPFGWPNEVEKTPTLALFGIYTSIKWQTFHHLLSPWVWIEENNLPFFAEHFPKLPKYNCRTNIWHQIRDERKDTDKWQVATKRPPHLQSVPRFSLSILRYRSLLLFTGPILNLNWYLQHTSLITGTLICHLIIITMIRPFSESGGNLNKKTSFPRQSFESQTNHGRVAPMRWGSL